MSRLSFEGAIERRTRKESPMSLTPSAAKVHHLHQRFSQGALDGCLDMATDDIEVSLHALGQTFRGREGFLQFMQGFKVAFPDIQIRALHYVSAGDEVVVEA